MVTEAHLKRIQQQQRLLWRMEVDEGAGAGGQGKRFRLDTTRAMTGPMCKLHNNAPASRQTQPCNRVHSLAS